MIETLPTMDVVVQKRTIEDFEVFSTKYVQKVMAENAILENLLIQFFRMIKPMKLLLDL